MARRALIENLPLSSDLSKLKQYPITRIAFITIKDNTQKTKWTTIGKINDWIRRYSSCYYIVRGTQGGIHFHLLAGIEKDRTPVPQKGIHFVIKYLHTKPDFSPEDIQWARDEENVMYYNLLDTIEEETSEFLLPGQQEEIARNIVEKRIELMKLRAKDRAQRANEENRTKKDVNVDNVLYYLLKNLNEERENPVTEYVDYISKLKP